MHWTLCFSFSLTCHQSCQINCCETMIHSCSAWSTMKEAQRLQSAIQDATVCCLSWAICVWWDFCFFAWKFNFSIRTFTHTNLDEGDEDAPSLLVDRWLGLFPSFSDSTRGLDGGTLELLPSSSSISPSPVTLGDSESRLSPSSWVGSVWIVAREIQLKTIFHFLVVLSFLTLSSEVRSLPSRFLWSSFNRSDFLHFARLFWNQTWISCVLQFIREIRIF